MNPRQLWSKHYGSLSAGVFALGLLGVLAVYGGSFNAMGNNAADPATTAPQAPPPASEAVPEVSAAEVVPADDEENADQPSGDGESDKDPLEQALADEEAKASERREAIREQINKDREAAGLPLLPAAADEGGSTRS